MGGLECDWWIIFVYKESACKTGHSESLTCMSATMVALREFFLQKERTPRFPEFTYEEAIHTVEDAWFNVYERDGFPIRDLLAGNRYLIIIIIIINALFKLKKSDQRF